MNTLELVKSIIDIRGLVNINELRLYNVRIRIGREVYPYTGCSEDLCKNQVQVYTNRTRCDRNLLNLLLRMKRFNGHRPIVFLMDGHKYNLRNIHIDSYNYVFTLIF